MTHHPAYLRECSETFARPTEAGAREWDVYMLAKWRADSGFSRDGTMDHAAFAAWIEVQS